jgi:carbon-monoxide dehydrogenase medium subunit
MLTQVESYHFASSLEEATALLAKEGGRAAVIAGGTDLVARGPNGIRTLVDISRLPLGRIDSSADGLHLGATATLQQLCDARPVQTYLDGLLVTAILASANRLTRNSATVGGNLVAPNSAWDLATALLVTEATVFLVGPQGSQHEVSIADYMREREEYANGHHIITHLLAPKVRQNQRAAFEKLNRCAYDAGVATAAVALTMEGQRIQSARLALGCVADRPIRAAAAEKLLSGASATSEAIEAAVEAAMKELKPPSDLRASSDYRRNMAGVLLRRALLRALGRGA